MLGFYAFGLDLGFTCSLELMIDVMYLRGCLVLNVGLDCCICKIVLGLAECCGLV